MAFTGSLGSQLGPLTTTWTMPDSCNIFALPCATCTKGFRGQQCVLKDAGDAGSTGEIQDHTTCWPPMTKDAGINGHPFNGWGFYSPGLACPAGYTTACTAEYGKRPGWEIQFTLDPGETAVGCCPEGFRCANIVGNTCIADITSGATTTVRTALCDGATMASIDQGVFPDVITTTINSTAVRTATREIYLRAPMFQLNYQPSDLSTTSTSASPLTGSTTTPTASSNNAANTNPTSPGTVQVGLSTGAAVGLGVGAALGGILLTTIAFAIWLSVRKRRQTAAAAAAAAGVEQVPPYDGNPKYWNATELDQGHGIAQMYSPPPPAEMAASPAFGFRAPS